MTSEAKSPDPASDPGASSTLQGLPFSWQEMALARVKPARFAELVGVTRSAVSTWIKKGWVDLYPDGTLDPRAAVDALLKRGNPARLRSKLLRHAGTEAEQLRRRVVELEARLAEGEGDAAPASLAGGHAEAYAEARARRERAAADKAEVELARMAGELMDAAEVVAVVGDAATRLRVALEGLPDRVAPHLANLDEAAARALLADHVEAALVELSQSFGKLAKAGASRPGVPAEITE